MLLMTKELEAKLESYPIASQDGLGEEAEVLVNHRRRETGERRLAAIWLYVYFRLGVGLRDAL